MKGGNPKAEEILTDQKCNYGCGLTAKYKFKMGKLCCSKTTTACPEIKRKGVLSSQNNIDENGLNPGQRGQKASIESRKNKGVDEDGLTSFQRAGKNIAKTKNAIVENGLTNAQLAGKKISISLNVKTITGLTPSENANIKTVAKRKSDVDENGLNSYQRGGIKAHLTAITPDDTGISNWNRYREDKFTIGSDGLSGFQRSAKKMLETMNLVGDDGLNSFERNTRKRLDDVDASGLNSFERGYKKGKWIQQYCDTNLYYQGSYELEFLEKLEILNGREWLLENVKRGPNVEYYDSQENKKRIYMSDFIIGNTIYEIKSSWTWDGKGGRPVIYQNNMDKLLATKYLGYTVILVLDGKEINV